MPLSALESMQPQPYFEFGKPHSATFIKVDEEQIRVRVIEL